MGSLADICGCSQPAASSYTEQRYVGHPEASDALQQFSEAVVCCVSCLAAHTSSSAADPTPSTPAALAADSPCGLSAAAVLFLPADEGPLLLGWSVMAAQAEVMDASLLLMSAWQSGAPTAVESAPLLACCVKLAAPVATSAVAAVRDPRLPLLHVASPSAEGSWLLHPVF